MIMKHLCIKQSYYETLVDKTRLQWNTCGKKIRLHWNDYNEALVDKARLLCNMWMKQVNYEALLDKKDYYGPCG